MKTTKQIDTFMGSSPEQQLILFKQMLKEGDLKKVPIQEIVRSSPLLGRWMDHTMEQTDTPDEFLAASGLQLISSVMGNQAYIMFGSTQIYPHIWCVLVAPSGFYRKTTALSLARRALAEMKLPVSWADHSKSNNSNDNEKGIKIIRSGADLIAPDRFSIDLIIEELQYRPAMIMFQSEYGGFLQELEKTYNHGAKETLTDIYDSGMFIKFNKTIKRENEGKPIVIDKTAFAIFGATTIHWLEQYVRRSDIGAGFIARFLFVPAYKKTRSHGWPKSGNKEVYESLKCDIAAIRKTVRGGFDASEIKPFYEMWYHDLEKRSETEQTSNNMIGFDTRLSGYALKFTMIMHASKYGNMELTLDSLISGIQLAEYFRSKTQELFETTFLSKFSKNVRKLAEFIYRNDHGKNKRQIQQRASAIDIRGEEFNLILETLLEEGDVHWDAAGNAAISKNSKFLKGVVRK